MTKEFNYINFSAATNGKYINGYIIKEDVCELHITDRKNTDICVLIDKDDFEKTKGYFWTFSKTGRNRDSISIYTYYNGTKKKLFLRSFILNGTKERIIARNREATDYRKANLIPGKDVYGTGQRKSLNRNSSGENCIYPVYNKQKKIRAYILKHKETNGYVKTMYFGIQTYKTPEECLKQAVEMREKSKRNA